MSSAQAAENYVFPLIFVLSSMKTSLVLFLQRVLHPTEVCCLCYRCWLSVDNHFIWSFIGPVTFIIMVSCFIFLWMLRLTEWGGDWEAEMKERDRGSEMGEPRGKSDGFLLLSLSWWWQVNFAPKTDFQASDNSPCLSAPDKDQDLIVYFNLAFTQLAWSLTLRTSSNGTSSYTFYDKGTEKDWKMALQCAFCSPYC